MKKIFIEASSFDGKRSGVGRYGLSISTALTRERPNDHFVFFNFLRPGRKLEYDFPLSSNTELKHIRWFPGRIFSLLMRHGVSLPLELFGLLTADLLIFPNFITWASLLHKPSISVVHDIAFEFFPEYIQKKNLAYLKTQLHRSLHRSTRVVAVSQATKNDLIKHYGISPEKIAVIYNAVDTNIFNPSAKDRTPSLLKKIGLPDRYLLYAGNLEPRKNLEGILSAYAKSYDIHKMPLVLVGAKGWNDQGITARLATVTHLPIHMTGYVSDAELAALYAGAEAFVYPSFYEGFGLPCLEAMACGCPVICSNTSSLPEVVGTAAIMVDPKDTGAIARAIVTITQDSELKTTLAQRGLTQAAQFTWEGSAKLLSQLIDEVTTPKA